MIPTFRWPLPGHTRISGRFNDPRSYGPHNAIDVPAPTHTRYYTLAPGRVLYAGPFGSCGLTVQVLHAYGWRSHVCHLHFLSVRTGQTVDSSKVLGLVGSTGDSTGPHAHINLFAPYSSRPSLGRFVPWVSAWAVDPLDYLPVPGQPRFYTVKPGDNASTIAATHHLSWARFKALNPQGPRSGLWRLIYPGERFRVG